MKLKEFQLPLSIIELGSITTGEELYKLVKEEIFSAYPSLKKKIIGICTDNHRAMISSKDAGLSNRIMAEIPHVVHVRDLCHCYNLIIEDALQAFPNFVLQFIKKLRLTLAMDRGIKHSESIKFKDRETLPLKSCAIKI